MAVRGASWVLWPAFAVLGCGAEQAIGASRLAITGGAEEHGYDAVFSLAYEGTGGCTGTCIAPRFGLTAAHCVEGESAEVLTALFGDTEEDPHTIVQVTAIASAPGGADVAMLAFAEDCPAVIPANRVALESHIEEPVVMVGFGVTAEEAEDWGIKRSGVATLFSVDPADVDGLEPGELATSNDPAGTCYGDSGGPTFMTFGGVEVVVGVTSRGSLDDRGREEPCGRGRSIAARADSQATFIDDFITEHGGVIDPGDGDEPGEGDDPGDGDEPDDGDPDDGDPDDGTDTPGEDEPLDDREPAGDEDLPADDDVASDLGAGGTTGVGCAMATPPSGGRSVALVALAAFASYKRRRARS
ncbi:MAG: trypsin-like serine protease [Deltaproteobacteria bacterium]|nr:trypsin-like serine protease [Deltaproteobacteria bacterium]